jgi:hypothetical protein
MTTTNRASRWTIALVWAHAALFAAIAVASYASPETAFGDAAWLPLARLAVLSFAGTLSAVVVTLVSAALSGTARQVGVALGAAMVLDAHAPYLLLSIPASIEYLDRAQGIRWWVLPQTFLSLFAVTTYTLVSMWRTRTIRCISTER